MRSYLAVSLEQDSPCFGKRLYITEQDAEFAVKWVKKNRKIETRWYKCPKCRAYHLTSKAKR